MGLIKTTIDAIKSLTRSNQKSNREAMKEYGNLENPRTAAKNIKLPAQSREQEKALKTEPAKAQIRVWKKLLPDLLKDLSKIPDPRNPSMVKHQITVLMFYGLFMFIFRLKSVRELNSTLTTATVMEALEAIFPEITLCPHYSTITRLLENIDSKYIQDAHIRLIKKLIRSKKFKKLYIEGKLPISLDGVQKVVRDGIHQDEHWLERTIKTTEGEKIQKYVYVIEVNITFSNGLTIPLLSEFLEYDCNPNPLKQDCELTGFNRVIDTLKMYFKRQEILILLDKLYASEPVMNALENKRWSYMIVLPSGKLKHINKFLNNGKVILSTLPDQHYYRGRKQKWFFQNDILRSSGKKVNAIICLESWTEVDPETGENVVKFSEYRWITNLHVSIENLHVIANLAARKRWLIEDSNNTEKNRGYNYKHRYAYDWNAMICYHLLMRLAHAINALSEFSRVIKEHINKYGWGRILSWIKDILTNPWVDFEWVKEAAKSPELKIII